MIEDALDELLRSWARAARLRFIFRGEDVKTQATIEGKSVDVPSPAHIESLLLHRIDKPSFEPGSWYSGSALIGGSERAIDAAAFAGGWQAVVHVAVSTSGSVEANLSARRGIIIQFKRRVAPGDAERLFPLLLEHLNGLRTVDEYSAFDLDTFFRENDSELST